MPYSSSTYTLLQNLSERTKDKHTYIDLLFSGLLSKDNDALLSLIRTSGLSPRGRIINNEEELLSALSERSWDLVICAENSEHAISPNQIASIISEQERDLPVMQLSSNDSELLERDVVQQGITYLIDREDESLILARVLREYQLLGERKRLHKVEVALEQTLHYNEQLLELSSVAYATLDNNQIIEANPAFRTLFSLDSDAPLPSLSTLTRGEDYQALTELLSESAGRTKRDITFQLGEESHFSAAVELTEIRLPSRTIRRLSIDPLSNLASLEIAPEEAISDSSGVFTELEQTVDNALAGGHDAFLIYLTLNPTGSHAADRKSTV